MNILLTGASGFIGTHVQQLLNQAGHTIHCIDSMEEQVHGPGWERWPRAGDQDYTQQYDVAIHLAAKVGVGQSMYEPVDYVDCNSLDTAKLLTKLKGRVKRLVVASSMSVYGEGAIDMLGNPYPTSEGKQVDLRSIYALTKYDQEQLSLIWGKANGVPTVALRFFNVYGPGQALNNAYTGCLAIFASRLLNGKPPVVYDDGQQTRDFIHVEDVARAVVHAALKPIEEGIYNVGTGQPHTIESVARTLAEKLGADIPPTITGQHREGDIRHCYANIDKIRATGWEPQVGWNEGLASYCDWLKGQPTPVDGFDKVAKELAEAGLVK